MCFIPMSARNDERQVMYRDGEVTCSRCEAPVEDLIETLSIDRTIEKVGSTMHVRRFQVQQTDKER